MVCCIDDMCLFFVKRELNKSFVFFLTFFPLELSVWCLVVVGSRKKVN
jgi:hypothetical protein